MRKHRVWIQGGVQSSFLKHRPYFLSVVIGEGFGYGKVKQVMQHKQSHDQTISTSISTHPSATRLQLQLWSSNTEISPAASCKWRDWFFRYVMHETLPVWIIGPLQTETLWDGVDCLFCSQCLIKNTTWTKIFTSSVCLKIINLQ